MTKQNYVIFLGIILITVLVLAGTVFVREKQKGPAPISQPPVITPPLIVTPPITSTPPTPEGWKTYENKEFGFAFDYPGDWEVIKKIPNSKTINFELWAPDQKVKNGDPRIVMQFNPNLSEQEMKVDFFLGFQYLGLRKDIQEITLPSGIKAYFGEMGAVPSDPVVEFVKFLIEKKRMSFTFFSQGGVPLNMHIVNTFRLTGKS